MGRAADLVGRRFGRLLVVSRHGTDENRSATWLCKCDCGETVVKRTSSLNAGYARSCGCLHNELSAARTIERNITHGASHTRLYRIWADMKKRCNNSSHWAFAYYGGKGIKVCSEWGDFVPFQKWAIENGYSDALTIDRIDNDGDYSPDNCCWSTRKEQANNKTSNVRYDLDGENYTIAQLSEKSGIPYQTLYARIRNRGWNVCRAVSTPIKGR